MKSKNFLNFVMCFSWIFSLIIVVLWIIKTGEYEPVLALVSILTFGIVEIIKEISKEDCTMPDVLANGYSNNFVIPVLLQIIDNSTETIPIFYILIPKDLSKVSPDSIRLINAELVRDHAAKLERIVLNEFSGTRKERDILNLDNGKAYLDFANTLVTLNDLVSLKIAKKKIRTSDKEKLELEKKYIDSFIKTTKYYLEENNLYPKYVKFIQSVKEINAN